MYAHAQAILSELASVRIHGLSKREIRSAIDFNMSDAESLFIERHQVYAEVSTYLRFTSGAHAHHACNYFSIPAMSACQHVITSKLSDLFLVALAGAARRVCEAFLEWGVCGGPEEGGPPVQVHAQ